MGDKYFDLAGISVLEFLVPEDYDLCLKKDSFHTGILTSKCLLYVSRLMLRVDMLRRG